MFIIVCVGFFLQFSLLRVELLRCHYVFERSLSTQRLVVRGVDGVRGGDRVVAVALPLFLVIWLFRCS